MNCGITHHEGCACHEQRHADEIARLTRERASATARYEALRAAVQADLAAEHELDERHTEREDVQANIDATPDERSAANEAYAQAVMHRTRTRIAWALLAGISGGSIFAPEALAVVLFGAAWTAKGRWMERQG